MSSSGSDQLLRELISRLETEPMSELRSSIRKYLEAIQQVRAEFDTPTVEELFNISYAQAILGTLMTKEGEVVKTVIYNALYDLCSAIHLSSEPELIHTKISQIRRYKQISFDLNSDHALIEILDHMQLVLQLALVVKFDLDRPSLPDRFITNPLILKTSGKRIHEFGENQGIILLAGGTNKRTSKYIKSHEDRLVRGFSGCQMVVISGSTSHGVAGFAGKLDSTYADVTSIGYYPGRHPRIGHMLSNNYSGHVATIGEEFSYVEPLAYWIDLVKSGIKSSSIKLLGIGGGKISKFEYTMALAFGITTGLIRGSEGSAEDVLGSSRWKADNRLEINDQHIATVISSFISDNTI